MTLPGYSEGYQAGLAHVRKTVDRNLPLGDAGGLATYRELSNLLIGLSRTHGPFNTGYRTAVEDAVAHGVKLGEGES